MKPLLLFALVAGGCYLKPSSTTPPVTSSEGVRVSLLGQDCEDHRGGKGDPVSRDLGVKVRVDNPTARPLHVRESSVRLVVDGQSGPMRGPGVVDVAPHGSATLAWDFTHRALCDSHREFVIALDDALLLDERPVTMASLAFRP